MSRALVYCAGGGIGDSLVASVVGRALHARYARVDALTLPGHRATLERVPDFDEILVDEGGEEAALAARLAAREYEACVVTWATARTARVPKLAKIPVRAGQARRLYSNAFTKRVTVRSERGDVTSPWAQILLDYARALDCDTADWYPAFVPTAQDVAEAAACRPERPYLILHPTNAIASKRGIWPTEGWARLARALAERFDATVCLSGAAADAEINAAILDHARDDRVVDIAGKLGIGAFGALASTARAFAGITTGTMHVAAAVGTPVVGIFPFQSDFPERWAPACARREIVRATFCCHPGDKKETCADYACIANLDVDRILAAASALIEGSAHARHDSTLHV